MNPSAIGTVIRQIRQQNGLTQAGLAERLGVSDKTVSKWETGRGCPDIALLEPIAEALGLSVSELLAGSPVANTNRAAGMLRARVAVCPLCGNVIVSTGEAVISCCGIALKPLDPQSPDEAHTPAVETVEDEFYITFDHEMSKTHSLSFVAAFCDNGVQLVKLYPEGPAEARVKISRTRFILFYCTRHGLFRVKAPRAERPRAADRLPAWKP